MKMNNKIIWISPDPTAYMSQPTVETKKRMKKINNKTSNKLESRSDLSLMKIIESDASLQSFIEQNIDVDDEEGEKWCQFVDYYIKYDINKAKNIILGREFDE